MKKRNVLVILCDQLRKDFLSVYGAEFMNTGNIAELADNGVVFDCAVTASPVCGPSRMSMYTGRHVSDHRSWTNNAPPRPGLTYIADAMRENGYETAAFGKMHVFPTDWNVGFDRVDFFEESRLGDSEPYLQFLRQKYPEASSVFNYDLPVNGMYWYGGKADYPLEDYYEHWIAGRAVDYIKQSHDRPFFAWLSFQGPHYPNDPPAPFYGRKSPTEMPPPLRRGRDCEEQGCYESRVHQRRWAALGWDKIDYDNISQVRAHYAEMIECIDYEIGRVVTALKEQGIYDNTTIIFSADHGEMLGDFGMFEKGPMPYRPQMDVPLIVSGLPEEISSLCGTRCGNPVSNLDLPGTSLDIAGSARGIGYSQSLLELLKGLRPSREMVYSEFCDEMRFVTDGSFRYCVYPFDGSEELYDIRHDPNELDNLIAPDRYASLSASERERVNQMTKRANKFILQYQIIAHGVKIEHWDFEPRLRREVERIAPHLEENGELEMRIPINNTWKDNLQKYGFEVDY